MFVWCPDGIYAMILGVNSFHLLGGTFNQVVLNIDEYHMEIGLSHLFGYCLFLLLLTESGKTYLSLSWSACLHIFAFWSSSWYFPFVSSLLYIFLCELKCCDDLSESLVLFILGQVA